VVPVCVAGGLYADYQMLEQELQAAQEADLSHGKLGGASTARGVARRMEKVRAQMREHTYEFRFRALAPQAWSDLIAAHPAREGQRERINLDTFRPAAVAACCVSPEGMGEQGAIDRLFAVLNQAQQLDLFAGAWDVNEESVSVPFSASASAALIDSGPSSAT
ncbi:MAG: hypothetical protein ACRDYV_12520, partial [Acidimicrobiia bacterium]